MKERLSPLKQGHQHLVHDRVGGDPVGQDRDVARERRGPHVHPVAARDGDGLGLERRGVVVQLHVLGEEVHGACVRRGGHQHLPACVVRADQ
ncbi:hypothetical protein LUW77_04270 [Streptomyces radiopugnans]|nr:hypothetical protein LUW77_04270 [Streptomyces radiopugnans]